jgi:regulatory protein
MAGSRSFGPPEARRKAMDFLARREYGRAELQAKLVEQGFAPDTAADAVGQLAREGLQDDRRFLDNFVQSRINQGKGPVRMRLELVQRGIDEALVNEILAERGGDWLALARAVRRRKFGAELPREFKDKARQMRFLQYRGFEPDHCRAAVSPGDDT